MRKPAVLLATALSTVALAGVVGIGVASADPTPTPTPSATATPTAGLRMVGPYGSRGPTTPARATPTAGASPSTKPGRPAKGAKGDKGKRDLTQRALHGEVTLGAKKQRVVDFQRGTVSTVSASSITVLSTDGFSATYGVDAKTKVRHAKEKAAIGDVKTGDKVRVVALKNGSTLTATKVADRTK
jgi:Cu/Ag efflux protein CusF